MKAYGIAITIPFPKGDEVKLTEKYVGMLASEYPTRTEICRVLEQTYERELNEIEFGYSGSRSYENIEREKDELELEFELSVEALKRGMYKIKFIQNIK